MKKNKLIIFVSCLAVSFCVINIASAQWALPLDSLGGTFGLTTNNPEDIIHELTLWLLGLVVAIGILAIIWAGITYVSSSGDTEQTTTAKKTVKYALLGIIVAGVAWALINVVVGTILS